MSSRKSVEGAYLPWRIQGGARGMRATLSWYNFFQFHAIFCSKHLAKQEFIPVGCVPAQRVDHIPACTVQGGLPCPGVYLPTGVYLSWRCTCQGEGCTCPGGVPAQEGGCTCLQTKYLAKEYLFRGCTCLLLPARGRGCTWLGVPAQEGRCTCPGWCTCPGGCIPACNGADTPCPPVNRMTDRQVLKHNLHKLLFAGSNNRGWCTPSGQSADHCKSIVTLAWCLWIGATYSYVYWIKCRMLLSWLK